MSECTCIVECSHCVEIARLTRERDEARAEVETLRALPSAEDLEERAHEILDGAGIPTHALDPVSGEEDYRAGLEERLEWTVEEITRARIENARLRRALEEATRALAVDPRYLSPARLGTARSILAAALAGEGEAPTCTWTQDDEGVWHTACRSSWLYPDGGSPADHGQVYCHACGKSIAAAAALAGEGE